ncbi:hypothetical protein LCGC14_0869380 [marine sediment metagenome]|uniref:Uncharacterized protein n=1 Tax=marine sediment metagenome TaxID=412755 RepID=A0A0F9PQP9_9ZZZZ
METDKTIEKIIDSINEVLVPKRPEKIILTVEYVFTLTELLEHLELVIGETINQDDIENFVQDNSPNAKIVQLRFE